MNTQTTQFERVGKDALAWLGVSSDDPHFEGPYFQSNFATAHVEAAQLLFEGGFAYYCDMTPADIEARNKAEAADGQRKAAPKAGRQASLRGAARRTGTTTMCPVGA